MKKAIILSLAVTALLSCGNGNNTGTATAQGALPKPGAVVAHAETTVTSDKLNHFKFSIKVVADSNIASGVYDVDADYGPNFNEGQFTMPKGGATYKPEIRSGAAPNTFVIGFHVPGDTTFYDYFEVSSDGKATKMQYLKSYTF